MKNEMPGHNILVVAPHLPEPDACAGDWRVFAFCRSLAERHRVTLLPVKPGRGGQEFWKKAGIDIADTRTRFPDLLRERGFSAVVFEWFYTAAHFLPFLPLCPAVVIDTHELYYRKARLMQKALGTRAVPPGFPEETRQRETAVYRAADILLAISAEERRVLRRTFPRKKILVLPMWTESGSNDVPPFEQRKDIVFFGSFQNPAQSPNADAVAYYAREIMPLVARALPGVRLHVSGFGSASFGRRFQAERPGLAVRFDGETDDIGGYLGRFKVFVSPLRFGAGVKKKILDAAAAGCPVVTTPVGNEGTGLRGGKSVMVASSPRELAQEIIRLYTDRALWDRLSAAARSSAARNNSYGAGMREFEQSLFGRGGNP